MLDSLCSMYYANGSLCKPEPQEPRLRRSIRQPEARDLLYHASFEAPKVDIIWSPMDLQWSVIE